MITLGLDIGSRYVGWAVLDERIMAHGVLDVSLANAWDTEESFLHRQVSVKCGQHSVRLIAVEAFHWRGRVSTHAPAIHRLIGAVYSLGWVDRRPILEIRAADWMQGVMGYLPHDHRLEHATWKGQIRDQLGLILKYRWPKVKKSDPMAYHDSDACGVAFHARNIFRMEQQMSAGLPR